RPPWRVGVHNGPFSYHPVYWLRRLSQTLLSAGRLPQAERLLLQIDYGRRVSPGGDGHHPYRANHHESTNNCVSFPLRRQDPGPFPLLLHTEYKIPMSAEDVSFSRLPSGYIPSPLEHLHMLEVCPAIS